MCFMWADYKCVLYGQITIMFYMGRLQICFIWADYNCVLYAQTNLFYVGRLAVNLKVVTVSFCMLSYLLYHKRFEFVSKLY